MNVLKSSPKLTVTVSAKLSDDLSAITKGSIKLNQVADKVNEQIGKLDNLLRKAGVGTEYWMQEPLEVSTRGQDPNDTNTYRTVEYNAVLGHARCDSIGEFHIAVKLSIWRNDPEAKNAEGYEDVIQVTPLVSCSRDIRLAAMAQISPLLGGLCRKIEGQIEAADQGLIRASELSDELESALI